MGRHAVFRHVIRDPRETNLPLNSEFQRLGSGGWDGRMIVETVKEQFGIYFRSVFLPFKGMIGEQHAHDVSHPTLCGSGKARLYVDGRFQEDVEAGGIVGIEAGKKHFFEALEDNTRLTCVFDAEKALRLKEEGF